MSGLRKHSLFGFNVLAVNLNLQSILQQVALEHLVFPAAVNCTCDTDESCRSATATCLFKSNAVLAFCIQNETTKEEIQHLLSNKDVVELHKRFGKRMEFGTAGKQGSLIHLSGNILSQI